MAALPSVTDQNRERIAAICCARLPALFLYSSVLPMPRLLPQTDQRLTGCHSFTALTTSSARALVQWMQFGLMLLWFQDLRWLPLHSGFDSELISQPFILGLSCNTD